MGLKQLLPQYIVMFYIPEKKENDDRNDEKKKKKDNNEKPPGIPEGQGYRTAEMKDDGKKSKHVTIFTRD
jgi:hypothetical protein